MDTQESSSGVNIDTNNASISTVEGTVETSELVKMSRREHIPSEEQPPLKAEEESSTIIQVASMDLDKPEPSDVRKMEVDEVPGVMERSDARNLVVLGHPEITASSQTPFDSTADIVYHGPSELHMDGYSGPQIDTPASEMPVTLDADPIIDGSQETSTASDGRRLNVTDALSYLEAVKQQFVDRPDVYNQFLDIMKDFKSEAIDTPGVIDRVSMLFEGHPRLIQGFNTFLPVGYRIECNVDAQDTTLITVTTPFGITTRSQGVIPPTVASIADPSSELEAVPDPQVQDSVEPVSYTHEQISPAMEYVTKIKQRFADRTDLYQEFLNILNLYKKTPVDEAQLAARIAHLFQGSPDLLTDFQVFLPRGILPPDMLGALDGATAAQKDDKPAKTNRKKIIEPVPSTSASTAPKRKRKPVDREKERERERERDREKEKEKEREKERLAQSKAKKLKHQHHTSAHDSFSQYAAPSPAARSYSQTTVQAPVHLAMVPAYEVPPLPPTQPTASSDESLFFERVRHAIDHHETYNEFLKLINLFTQEIIDMRKLVEQSRTYLTDELFAQFKEILGWDTTWENSRGYGMNMGGHHENFERPSREELSVRYGPSYRRLPRDEVNVVCSGRDEMCKSVLNDEWVSHPTWASEDSGFVAHRKNAYEEALHRSEEERHEYDFHIEAIMRTIAMLEPYNAKIMQLSPEERPMYKQKISLIGVNKSIHQRIIKKVYGRDAGLEVVQAIHEIPGIAIPMVLLRLKQKEDEWKRAQREWNKVWREVDARNYQKSLDHQGITFKANDKKATTVKSFVSQIESAREEQLAKRAAYIDPTFARTRPRYQMAFVIEDMSVLQDLLKLTFSFLDRLQHQITFSDRRRIEGFLRYFVPMFFMLDSASFNNAFKTRNETHDTEFFLGDYTSILDESEDPAAVAANARSGRNGRRGAGNDLRKKLLKNATHDKSANRKAKGAVAIDTSRQTVPMDNIIPEAAHTLAAVHENGQSLLPDAAMRMMPKGREPQRRGTFFTNSSLYALLRLFELLYARLLECKTLSAKLASDPSSPYLSSQLASELALLDMDAPDPRLYALRQRQNPAAHFYDYLLESCERLFDNEIDQLMFEEIARYMFGTKAYVMFTVDKVIGSIIKQVQSILSEKRTLLLLEGLKRERDLLVPTSQDQDDLRISAEKIIGIEENLFRIDWLPESHSMTMQLLGKDDASFDDVDVYTGRWQAYIDSYASDEVTKGLVDVKTSPPFLSRNLRKVMKNPIDNKLCTRSGLEIKDFLWREWTSTDAETVDRRLKSAISANKECLAHLDKEGTLT